MQIKQIETEQKFRLKLYLLPTPSIYQSTLFNFQSKVYKFIQCIGFKLASGIMKWGLMMIILPLMDSFVEWFNSNKIWYLRYDLNSAVVNTWNHDKLISIDYLWYKSKILFNWTILINVSIMCHYSVYAGFFLDTNLNNQHTFVVWHLFALP